MTTKNYYLGWLQKKFKNFIILQTAKIQQQNTV